MQRSLSTLFLAAVLAAFAAPALAQTASLTINANVNASCRVAAGSTTPTISIGYDVFTPASATGNVNVSVACTKGTTIQVAANTGGNGAAGGFLRSVKSGANAIGYKLSLTAGGTELADSVAASSGVPSAGKGSPVDVPIYVTLDTVADPVANPVASPYTDTVLLTYTAL
jgi:spore coat protein U-like protein